MSLYGMDALISFDILDMFDTPWSCKLPMLVEISMGNLKREDYSLASNLPYCGNPMLTVSSGWQSLSGDDGVSYEGSRW